MCEPLPAVAAAAGEGEKSQPPYEVAGVVRGCGPEFLARYRPSIEQRRVLHAIARCRTAALGGHRRECEACGHQHIAADYDDRSPPARRTEYFVHGTPQKRRVRRRLARNRPPSAQESPSSASLARW